MNKTVQVYLVILIGNYIIIDNTSFIMFYFILYIIILKFKTMKILTTFEIIIYLHTIQDIKIISTI